ncbi:threonine synthase [Salinibaculum salinum]|uniref:threonine synthase n=1 Tax=Salinibaculum salinum TaxID=3131996 RepID=UPI0030EB97DC
METTAAFAGFRCIDCGARHDAAESHRCPDCGGWLDARYDHGKIDLDHGSLTPDASAGIAAYADLLPFGAETLVTVGEAGTPLLACPGLADDLGVDAVYVKDEGLSTTGAALDRGMALAVTAAREHGATDVALPSMGNGGQAAAAYAARAGLDSHSFVPSRTPFVNKAMVNVHGGDMSVVGGRYADAAEAFRDAMTDEEWHSVAPFVSPYRHEGMKTLAYEIAAQLDWTAPDAVVHPTGHGAGIVGLDKGFSELATHGLLDDDAALYAAQAGGCAPYATAWEDGADEPAPVEHPDTIVGPLEIPDPAGGEWVIDALESTGGAAVATGDQGILEGAVSLAEAGITMGASGGAALSGAHVLAEQGAFDGDDVVVLVNPTTGNKEADILRSHLMSKGI